MVVLSGSLLAVLLNKGLETKEITFKKAHDLVKASWRHAGFSEYDVEKVFWRTIYGEAIYIMAKMIWHTYYKAEATAFTIRHPEVVLEDYLNALGFLGQLGGIQTIAWTVLSPYMARFVAKEIGPELDKAWEEEVESNPMIKYGHYFFNEYFFPIALGIPCFFAFLEWKSYRRRQKYV